MPLRLTFYSVKWINHCYITSWNKSLVNNNQWLPIVSSYMWWCSSVLFQNDVIRYTVVDDSDGQAADEYFWLDQDTGEISPRKPLSDAPESEYSVSILVLPLLTKHFASFLCIHHLYPLYPLYKKKYVIITIVARRNEFKIKFEIYYPVNTIMCITFIRCWANVEDVGSPLYKCYTYVLC